MSQSKADCNKDTSDIKKIVIGRTSAKDGAIPILKKLIYKLNDLWRHLWLVRFAR